MWDFTLWYFLPFIAFVVLVFFVESERFGWATVAALSAVGAYGYLYRSDVLGFLKENVVGTLIGVGIYIVAGVAWSFIRWMLHLIKFRNQFREFTETFKKKEKLLLATPIPPEKMADFHRWLWRTAHLEMAVRPQANEHKSKIVGWMSFWPCSIMGYLLNDPVKRVFTALFDYFRSSYQRLANSIITDVEFDVRPLPDPEPSKDDK